MKEELTENELKKIHNRLGHVSVDKLVKLIVNANRTSNKAMLERRLKV